MKAYRIKFFGFIVLIAVIIICSQIISSVMFYSEDIKNHKEIVRIINNHYSKILNDAIKNNNFQKDGTNILSLATNYLIKNTQICNRIENTEEVVIGLKNKDDIFITGITSSSQEIREEPGIIKNSSLLAIPMKMSLSGQTGTIIAKDYKGNMVIAAYSPIEGTNLGIVVKVNLDEVRKPFIRTTIFIIIITLIIIVIISIISYYMTKPLLATIQEDKEQIRALSGLLPICASCKQIRDDKGYWNKLESYIKDRSEANFSHSLCPECAKKLYPDMNDTLEKHNQGGNDSPETHEQA